MFRPRRAERLAHADLARPLGHRHEHDVHDADAAHQETHGRDARQQVGEDLRRLAERVQKVRLVADLEVVGPVLAQLDARVAGSSGCPPSRPESSPRSTASTLIERSRSMPKTRKRAVLIGMRICSSGFPKRLACPLDSSTPTTVNWMPRMRIVLTDDRIGRLEPRGCPRRRARARRRAASPRPPCA